MAVYACNLLWTGRSGSGDINNKRVYRETWELLCDTTTVDGPLTVSAYPLLPQRGTPYNGDPFAIVTEVEVLQSDESPLIWRAEVTYDSDPDFKYPDPEDLPENPLARPAVWKFTFGKSSEVCRRWYAVDAGGNVAAALSAVTNSALLPYDPPLMVDVSRPIIRVTQNVPVVSANYLLLLQDAVNSKPWQGLQARQVKIDAVEANSRYEANIAFVEISVDFMLKQETWDARPLDCGYAELTQRTDSTSTTIPPATIKTWTKIRDPFGNFATEPVPLNGNGKKLAPGAPPVFLRGVPSNYQLIDFNTLFTFTAPVVFGG